MHPNQTQLVVNRNRCSDQISINEQSEEDQDESHFGGNSKFLNQHRLDQTRIAPGQVGQRNILAENQPKHDSSLMLEGLADQTVADQTMVLNQTRDVRAATF